MEYELRKKVTYSFELAEADIEAYWGKRPSPLDTSEEADNIRDRQNESIDAFTPIIVTLLEGGDREGFLTAKVVTDLAFEEFIPQIESALEVDTGAWVMHWRGEYEEELC